MCFSTSRTLGRETFNCLAESGLLELRPRRGGGGNFGSCGAQHFEVLAGFEGLYVYYAAERVTADERLALRSRRTPTSGNDRMVASGQHESP